MELVEGSTRRACFKIVLGVNSPFKIEAKIEHSSQSHYCRSTVTVTIVFSTIKSKKTTLPRTLPPKWIQIQVR